MTEMPQPPAAQPAAPLSDSDARLYVTLAHVGNILFPGLAPLIMWLIGKDKSSFVNTEGKEALNFGILLVIAYIAGIILTVILIGILVILAAWIMSIIFGIQGAMKSNKGESYRYPFSLRLIK
ncbi:DUF4870 domain-containing protein [Demequina lutea]|uniref:DUF4870 domain-containing protein n=1 Tax=Demequina lutea TaxID=431489 RepID=A0A7Y9ZA75_9MICO|nr:DUF4870 domain-containing protein [Demequina lutea]NYI41060.1 hypothetical protein [Demequina lutea]